MMSTWFRRWLSSPTRSQEQSDRRQRPPRRSRASLGVELLENRTMPSTFVVTNLNDSGAGSLRDAIDTADLDADHDTITFAVQGTIHLTSSLQPDTVMDILGPGADLLTISPADGAPDFRMMRIRNEVTDNPILVSGLKFAGGRADHGVAIDNHGSVIVVDCTFTGNTQTDPADGGILYNIIDGQMDLYNCVVTGNTGQRGAVYNEGSGTLNISGCTITNNTTKLGGGIYSGGGTVNITNTVVSDNTAVGFGIFVFHERAAGGGVYNLGTMTITDSSIRNNLALGGSGSNFVGHGGGIYNEGDLTITGSDIGANSARFTGGGIWNTNDLTITNCTIQDNFVLDNTWGYGGGITNEILVVSRPQLQISNSVVTRNTVGFSGGGIWNNGELIVDACTISENNAGRWFGGGISHNLVETLFDRSSAVITNTTIANNIAGSTGGGIATEDGAPLTLTNCTVSGNRAVSKGGGLYLELATFGSNVQIRNSTIAYNIATSAIYPAEAGGMYIERFRGTAGQVQITNSTIAHNSAQRGPGGIRVNPWHIPTFLLRLDNTIVAANTGPTGDIDGTRVATGSTIVDPSSRHNLIGSANHPTIAAPLGVVHGVNGNMVGTTAAPIAPLLGPLQDNGGPTHTLALLPGSLAIDAGNNALAAGPYDQRGPGYPRIVNGTVDIGAYELQAAPINEPPVLGDLPDLTISADQDIITVPLTATDPNGDPLTFTATAESLAYVLDQQYGLAFAGDYYENWGGWGEKWLLGTGDIWYYILSNGELYRWEGETSTLMGIVGASYWADPSLLHEAQAGQLHATLSIVDGVLVIDRDDGFVGSVVVTVSVSDGYLSDSRQFTLTVLA